MQQGSNLTGGGESGEGSFGVSVALSADGNTALIGGAGNDFEVGAAWVFTRSGSTWTEQAKLTGSGGIEPRRFGESVALSADGNTAVVGGPEDNIGTGAVWVFTRSGGTWTQQGSELTGGGEVEAGEFGRSVAVSADGNTALVGGPEGNVGTGAAWVFTRSGTTWTEQAKLAAGGESGGGRFGFSVALGENGDTALIGGPRDANGVGAAWVFTRAGSTWSQQGSKLTGSDESGAGEFGDSVALAANGNSGLIGAPEDDKVGAAWVFTRSGSAWTQQGSKFTGSGESAGGASFGRSVAFSGNGGTALIGGPLETPKRTGPRGCSRARAARGPSRAASSRAVARPPKANSGTVLRSETTGTRP